MRLAGKAIRLQGLGDLEFQQLVQASQQYVGTPSRITMHGNDGVADGDELERARLVEPMTGEVQAIEVVARSPQSFEEVETMLVAGDQARHLGGASFDQSAVRRENGNP